MYIDPDEFLGTVTQAETIVDNNTVTITAKGYSPAVIKGTFTAIHARSFPKNTERDRIKALLKDAQKDFASDMPVSYKQFSEATDLLAIILGKDTGAGQQVLELRHHLLSTSKLHDHGGGSSSSSSVVPGSSSSSSVTPGSSSSSSSSTPGSSSSSSS